MIFRSGYGIIQGGGGCMQTIGQYLRQKREEKKLSLFEVYTKTGITDSRLSKIENDCNREPSPLLLKKLAGLYELSIIELFIKAGYLTYDSLDLSTQVFHGTEYLTDDDKKHIQGQIDFIISKYNK